MVMICPAIWWGWSPPMKFVPFVEDPLENLQMLLIPSAILGTALSAGTMRMTRTMMLEVLRQDYIRTAWSKGLGFGLPAQIPSWGGMLSREGRVFMETAPWLALWPGLFLTLTVYILNMLGDAVRDLLDPRLRGGGALVAAERAT